MADFETDGVRKWACYKRRIRGALGACELSGSRLDRRVQQRHVVQDRNVAAIYRPNGEGGGRDSRGKTACQNRSWAGEKPATGQSRMRE